MHEYDRHVPKESTSTNSQSFASRAVAAEEDYVDIAGRDRSDVGAFAVSCAVVLMGGSTKVLEIGLEIGLGREGEGVKGVAGICSCHLLQMVCAQPDRRREGTYHRVTIDNTIEVVRE